MERYICDRNYFSHYNIIHQTICKNSSSLNPLISFSLWNENGFIENLQSLFLFLGIIYISLSIKIYKKKDIIKKLLVIKLIGLIYFLGEEISWGQHFFNWQSPIFFKNINNQGETNLHNISNLFDQLPRTLVLIWCSLSSISIILVSKFFKIRNSIIIFICPDKKLLYLSVLLLFFVIPDLIFDKLNFLDDYLDSDDNPIRIKIFYDLITFKFIRLSELHELIFTFYFFIYSLLISDKYKKIIIDN